MIGSSVGCDGQSSSVSSPVVSSHVAGKMHCGFGTEAESVGTA